MISLSLSLYHRHQTLYEQEITSKECEIRAIRVNNCSIYGVWLLDRTVSRTPSKVHLHNSNSSDIPVVVLFRAAVGICMVSRVYHSSGNQVLSSVTLQAQEATLHPSSCFCLKISLIVNSAKMRPNNVMTKSVVTMCMGNSYQSLRSPVSLSHCLSLSLSCYRFY